MIAARSKSSRSASLPRGLGRGRFSAAQIARIECFVDEHLGTAFSVTDLAALMHLGTQRFAQRFRLTLGVTPWRYVQQRRATKARELLAQEAIPLAEIALRLGYSSQSHFATAFKQVVGVAPGVYRRYLLAGADLAVGGPSTVAPPPSRQSG